MAGPDHTPPRKRRWLVPVIILVSLLVLIAVGILVTYAVSDDIYHEPLRYSDPRAHLGLVISNTLENIGETPGAFPNLDRFQGRPMSHYLNIDISDIISGTAIGFIPGMNTSAVITALTDWENENLLIGFSMHSLFFSLTENQIFISPDLVGISIPMLFGRYGFITADPATFTEDWNNSEFADMIAEIPYDFDLARVIELFFSEMRDEGREDWDFLIDEMMQTIQDLGLELIRSAYIEDMGNTARNETHFRMTIPKNNATWFVEDATYEILSTILEIAQISDNYWLLYEMQDIIDDFHEYFEFNFNDDILIDFYFERGSLRDFFGGRVSLLSRVYIHNITFDVQDWDETITIEASQDFIFGSGEHVLHGLESRTRIFDDYGDGIELILINSSVSTPDLVRDRWDLVIYAFDYDDIFEINAVYEFEWLKSAQIAENMSMLISLYVEDEISLGIEITGNLIETGDMTELSSGVIALTAEDQWMRDEYHFSLGFSYRVRPISPDEITIEGQRSTDFFSFGYDDLMDIFWGMLW